MDVVISSGWRSGTSHHVVESLEEPRSRSIMRTPGDTFISRHGRYEVTLSRDGDGWLIEYSSTGRLFGPRVVIYAERHLIARHAAWDVMCRVIRATGDEQQGIEAGRRAALWLQDRATVC